MAVRQGGVNKRTCAFEGCAVTTKGATGYCAQHCLKARKCSIDGCQNSVASWSRSECCTEHKSVARKLRQAGLI